MIYEQKDTYRFILLPKKKKKTPNTFFKFELRPMMCLPSSEAFARNVPFSSCYSRSGRVSVVR